MGTGREGDQSDSPSAQPFRAGSGPLLSDGYPTLLYYGIHKITYRSGCFTQSSHRRLATFGIWPWYMLQYRLVPLETK
jgi:hypothetical protein